MGNHATITVVAAGKANVMTLLCFPTIAAAFRLTGGHIMVRTPLVTTGFRSFLFGYGHGFVS
jgi:hypothetical protein